MINFKLVYKIIGQLLFIETAMMLVCTMIAIAYHEDDLLALSISALITVGGAFTFRFWGRKADNNLGRKEAYLVVTLTWIVFSMFGSLPFLIGGYLTNPADAYFETMSGFTTTGATIIDDVEVLPHGILFWRALTQWIGGLGIVFFTIAILPSMVGGSVKIFSAEATGPLKAKLHPRLTTTAKWLWSIYFVITFACAATYFLLGMNIYDSVNYSLTTTATGGFSTHNDSMEFLHSTAIEYASIFFMFISGVNFTMLYMAVIKGKIKTLFKNSEFQFYLGLVALATGVIAFLLVTKNGYHFGTALKNALFQVVSFMTTTGLFNDDAAKWPHVTWIILGVVMFFGACAGSTSGGFKCIRAVISLKMIRNEFKHILHPRAVLPVKISGQCVPVSAQASLLAFTALFILACLCTSVYMIVIGVDNVNAITISLSCISNVGPTLGTEIGPVMSWSILPDSVKWACSFLMLMGRLEIMSVLVLFTPAFWKDN